jgi:diaminohydroxyphosphoribosylaminopyrimidine deaminase/5-amino-6-(5-phosphoribosylamino)uracil reductase
VVAREGRPFVILKAALSVDGGIAEATGRRTALTSTEANHRAHGVRAEVDAIGVGVGTILVDDPQLTVRGVHRERPLARVVFDRRLRTPPDARVLSTRGAGPVIIVTTPAAAGRRPVSRRPAVQPGVAVSARGRSAWSGCFGGRICSRVSL